MGMTVTQYARHRGCSAQSVYKALDSERIRRDADGLIDAEKADRDWAANTMPRLSSFEANSYRKPRAASSRATNDEGLSLAEAKRLNENLRAEERRIKIGVLRGEYVPIKEVERVWTDGLRRLRSAILAIPSRYRQQLPHLSARDIDVLDRELRATLLELSGCAEEREPDDPV